LKNGKINVAIGFATGRKHFQRILRSYVYNWFESNLVNNKNVGLHLFVAYDLDYRHTKKTDYTKVDPEIAECLESKYFIGKNEMEDARKFLVDSGVVSMKDTYLLFGKGYASQRNIILYYAIKNKMDYILFLDDDEYPMAVTKNSDTALWGGQQILKIHLQNIIEKADITYGYHCGYISPIPQVEFSDTLKEKDFCQFIQAISNDIVNWETTKKVLNNGGVTYADTKLLTSHKVYEVPEINHTKFISGSNLCLKLTDPKRTFPFYNPPGARGEDTFLSTCLSERTVLRVPCYAFHDGFSSYTYLLEGVMPTTLRSIQPKSELVVRRFYNACIGWIRYKPLLLFITDQEHYEDKIKDMTEKLCQTLPTICSYFKTNSFMKILNELKKYDRSVREHNKKFERTKLIWSNVSDMFESQKNL
jgi:hypothetical protein